jgi:hypothetical protein
MELIRPGELWLGFCKNNGLDPFERDNKHYELFKKLFSNIKKHFAGDTALDKDLCWEWGGRFGTRGYPYVGTVLANRAAYCMFRGPIKAGYKLFRACGQRRCVNPFHALQLSQAELFLKSPQAPANRTSCPAGHPYNAQNSYRDSAGRRRCRLCTREQARRRRERIRLAARKHKRRRRPKKVNKDDQ